MSCRPLLYCCNKHGVKRWVNLSYPLSAVWKDVSLYPTHEGACSPGTSRHLQQYLPGTRYCTQVVYSLYLHHAFHFSLPSGLHRRALGLPLRLRLLGGQLRWRRPALAPPLPLAAAPLALARRRGFGGSGGGGGSGFAAFAGPPCRCSSTLLHPCMARIVNQQTRPEGGGVTRLHTFSRGSPRYCTYHCNRIATCLLYVCMS